MIIIVDTNEKATNPAMYESLQKHFSNVMIANIASDIQIPLDDGSILAIERKTPMDFLASIADRRIFEQVERMATIAKYSAFIVTGSFHYGKQDDMVYVSKELENGKLTKKEVKELKETNWRGLSVRSVITLLQFSGCGVIFCPATRFPQQVEELYSTVNKPEMRHGMKQKRIITWPPLDERIQMLVPLVGGLQRSESLLSFAKSELLDDPNDEYGTLADAIAWGTIMNMVDHENRPAGWGPKTILNFRKRLGLQSNEYVKVEKDDSNPDKEPF